MKKILALTLLLGSSIVFVPSAEAAEKNSELSIEANATSPQIYTQRRRNRRGARVVTRTRIVRSGYRTYREVVQYRYQPNGRVVIRVLSRSRIR